MGAQPSAPKRKEIEALLSSKKLAVAKGAARRQVGAAPVNGRVRRKAAFAEKRY
jgi:hypothetical protein